MNTKKSLIAGIGAAVLLAAGSVSAEPMKSGGVVYREGKAYVVVDGKTTPINETTVPDGKMMTFSGEMVDAPEAVSGTREGGRASEAQKTENKAEQKSGTDASSSTNNPSTTSGRGADVVTPDTKKN
ncbi:hypothetical protein FEM03_19530 [Phragmitibacter flavus]|uniref:Uncharacterized protein n=1 Tax=Phragmitibacter flavus TaxID=2576071 RepID=A0A5R8K9N4_9BACT|nr:hypothetical protein [Phragmitibacter flavus]TLD69062.1 hypothetical protein FEM03_19530 [Phragmitibacter flavus]